MAVVTIMGGDQLPETKIKTIANTLDIITQGSLTATDYNLDLGGLSIMAFREACQSNMEQFAADVYIAPVAAQGLLTLGVEPSDNDGLIIGTKSYTFKTTAASTNDVAIGGSLAQAKLNLVIAINTGDTYNTVNADVTTGAFSTDELTITANITGTVGNAIATTESFDNAGNFFDGTTLGTETAGAGYTLATLEQLEGGDFINRIREDLNANFIILDAAISP